MTADERRTPATSNRADGLATARSVFLGSEQGGPRRAVLTGLAIGLSVLTFLAYEFGIFYDSGGVVFIPFHAALVGGAAAFWTGYSRTGLLSGWVLTYAPLLGWRAEWATEISPRPLLRRVAYVVQLDGLVALAIMGFGVAVVGFTVGALTGKGIDVLQTGSRTTTDT
jgi:hypothetical protein